MAFTIPNILNDNYRATKGEKKVFDYLKSRLPDDFIVYYNIPVASYYPDFIIIGKELGIFVLEVKDWKLENIKRMNNQEFDILINGNIKTVKNPAIQAREYILKIIDMIEKKSLISSANMKLKWGFGVIFSEIKENDFNKIFDLYRIKFCDLLGWDFVFNKDDLKDNSLVDKIYSKMQGHFGKITLKEKDIDFIRGVIYPELIIDWKEDVIKIMDRNQENLAKTLPSGHNIIRGVTGSGKTVVLISRAKFLSTLYPQKKILFLCYNKSLAHYIFSGVRNFKNIEVHTYHSWCLMELSKNKIPFKKYDDCKDKDKYFDEYIPSLIIDNIDKIKDRYDFVLIDEGQDFSDIWYKTVIQVINPQTNSLLIAIDSSQTIYKRKVSWEKLGIDIRGRSRIFRKNYRNTRQILEKAYDFIKDLDKEGLCVFEDDPVFIEPEYSMREGDPPVVVNFKSREDELNYLCDSISKSNKSMTNLILCSTHSYEEFVYNYLKKRNIDVSYIDENKDANVIISTIHSSKGLEADNVFIIDYNLVEKYFKEEYKRLLYIAMTRAINNLYIFSCDY